MFFVTAIVFILIFSLLILIHEFGHFYAAKRAGIKVEEFGMGLPPRIFGVKKGETLYSINWIPFGGFVRMLGEDPTAKGAKTSKRSFSNKSLRAQTVVVCAGVFMNLLLAFVLLTFGFLIGVEPLIVDEADFYQAVRDEQLHLEPGIVVLPGEDEADFVLEAGDRILDFDDLGEWENFLYSTSTSKDSVSLNVLKSDGSLLDVIVNYEDLNGLDFAPLYLPRFVYKESASSILNTYLDEGDVILEVDGQNVITEADLFESLNGTSVDLLVDRPGSGLVYLNDVSLPYEYPIITFVGEASPAAMAGVLEGDRIVSVNGQTLGEELLNAHDIAELTTSFNPEDRIVYEFARNGEVFTELVALDENGRIGIAMADFVSYYGELSLYHDTTIHTLVGFEEVQLTWEAPFVAIQEMWRLGKLTAVMFVDVLGQFLSGGQVPDGVAGPVGIAQMTSISLQAGFDAVIRFVALLSLSLGVINILPIPALDGGRMVFITYQAITGRKANARMEALIHMAGFVLLILFIAYVTFNDFLRIF